LVAKRLSELPQVRYVGASTGRVDLIVEVVVKIYKQSWSWAIRAD
jgi:hypothetical protein